MASSEDEDEKLEAKKAANEKVPPTVEGDQKPEAKRSYRSSNHGAYTDYSSATIDLHSPQSVERNSQSNVPIRYRKFPAKLDAMLSSPDFERYISWMPHGRSWKVHDAEGFLAHVLPKFFDNQSFSSFIRLVNAWGFRRKTNDGIDRNSYYHELFLRGKPHLHERMARLGTHKKKPIGSEPDLSAFPPLPALQSTFSSLPASSTDGVLTSSGRSSVSSAATTTTGSSAFDSRDIVRNPQSTTFPRGMQAAPSASNQDSDRANLQQILRLLQQGTVQNSELLRDSRRERGEQPTSPSRPLPALDQIWGHLAASTSDSDSAHPSMIFGLSNLIRGQAQQQQIGPLLNHEPEQEQKQESDPRGNNLLGTALATEAFVEQAARELASRQIQEEASSSHLLLASLLDQTSPPSTLLRSLRRHQQLPSIPNRTPLLDLHAAIATGSSSMVPNYLRHAPGTTSSAQLHERFSRAGAAFERNMSPNQRDQRNARRERETKRGDEDDTREARKTNEDQHLR